MKENAGTGKIRTKSRDNIFIDRWYVFPVILFILAVVVFYVVIGENSYIAIADNMDLFVPQYQMLGMRNIYFAHGAAAPFLDGISRDVLPSEYNVVSLLYMIFPPFAAYVANYACKVIVAVISFYLLGKELLFYTCTGVQKYSRDQKAVFTLTGLVYGVLNLFPNFGIAFSAIPLALYLFLKLDRIVSGKKMVRKIWTVQNGSTTGTGKGKRHGSKKEKTPVRQIKRTSRYKRRVALIYLSLFLYPLVSYFSYFGFFILAYATLTFLVMSIRRKSIQGHLLLGVCALAAGYVIFEYRLFIMMLFGTEETIRETMQMASVDVRGIFTTALSALTTPYMHEADMHQYFVMPLCIFLFVFINGRRLICGRIREIFTDVFNLCVLGLLFNSLIAGLYAYAPFRNLVATLLPPLTGFQFDRTTFFNPFLWYAMLAVICVRLVSLPLVSKWQAALAYIFLVVSMFIILLTPTTYNDLRATLAGQIHARRDGVRIDTMNWKEFYSEDLFTKIKEDIDYQDEWCVAYGMYPAVLEYNGICTLDGYLGFYSQEYKEEFRKIIAPALERVEANRLYFDNWGARCYLFSGTDASIHLGSKSLQGLTDTDIYIDTQALKSLYGKFLFSRVKLTNAFEAGLTLLKSYEEETQAYPVYVYQVE